MRLALALVITSLFAFVLGSPLTDISPNTQQLLLSSNDNTNQCQPEGTLCDYPAGTRGLCCAPLLCVPLSTHKSPYSICANLRI
ncbi:hypothetical protein EV363DRAFT_1359733 [Boletus edulis]|nr:hypothetical protein EV363DRAFT_1359733 [Boletus edulis]